MIPMDDPYTLSRDLIPHRMQRFDRPESIDGVEAERIGFINRAVEPEALEAEVKKWAEELMGLPPLAVGLGKRMVDKALDMDILTSLDVNAQVQSMLIKTEDFTEAMRARVEKRRPQFKGK